MMLFAQNRATFYFNASYGGKAVGLPEGTYTLSKLNQKGIENNQISSIKVTSGYEVVIFDLDNFDYTGLTKIINSMDVADLNTNYSMHNKMTSVIIRKAPPVATFYYDNNYKGRTVVLPVGEFTLNDLNMYAIGDNQVSSLKVIAGNEAVIFDGDYFDYTGLVKLIKGIISVPDLSTYSMNNKITSVIIRKTPPMAATFYYNNNYTGKAVALPEGEFTLNDLKFYGIDDNQISSVKMNKDIQVTIFNGDNYDVNAHAQSFNGISIPEFDSHMLNNLMTSVIIRKIPAKKAIFYLDFNYKGNPILLPEGCYGRTNLALLGLNRNIEIKSVKTAGMKVTLYEGHHYGGSSKSFSTDKMNLNQIKWKDMTRSVKVFDTKFNSLAGGGLGSGNDEGDEESNNDESEFANRTSTTTDLQLNVYPNPATDFVDIKDSGEIEKVELVNYSGKKENIKVTKSSNNTTRIDLSAVQGGAYLLVGTTKNGKSISKRIMIQNKK
ncbi:T9SS type A sorting domain-containing protein [Chryseobacterium aquaeductus]|nr:T9SS type A sorting domain-containing protein [Chryseobacterium aquaeductus]